jgi:hypothetical protein
LGNVAGGVEVGAGARDVGVAAGRGTAAGVVIGEIRVTEGGDVGAGAHAPTANNSRANQRRIVYSFGVLGTIVPVILGHPSQYDA